MNNEQYQQKRQFDLHNITPSEMSGNHVCNAIAGRTVVSDSEKPFPLWPEFRVKILVTIAKNSASQD